MGTKSFLVGVLVGALLLWILLRQSDFGLFFVTELSIKSGFFVGFILGLAFGGTTQSNVRATSIGVIAAIFGGGIFVFGLNLVLQFILALSIGFIPGIVVSIIIRRYAVARSSASAWAWLSHPRIPTLTTKYGPGFVTLDGYILDAVGKDRTTVPEISLYVNKSQLEVSERIAFLIRKGVLGAEGEKVWLIK